MPRLSDSHLPLAGITVLRGAPAPGGRRIVRVLVATKPLSDARDGALRLRLAIEDAAKRLPAAHVVAVGIGDPGRPAFLAAEAALAPGTYRIRPDGHQAPDARFVLPGSGSAPLEVLCEHETLSPSRSSRQALFSPRGETLAGIVVRRIEPCCRGFVRQRQIPWGNQGFLVVTRPLGNPVHIEIDARVHVVRPGQYLVSPPGQADRFSPKIPYPVHMRQYFVFPMGLAAFAAALDAGKGDDIFGLDPAPRTMPPALAQALDAFEQALASSDTPLRDLDARSLLHHALCLLLQSGADRDAPAATRREDATSLDPRLKLAMDHLSAHLAEPYDRIALARAARTSDQHLRWLFQTRLGMPPVEYLQALRVERAKKLLADPAKKLQAVAWEVGYTDARTFRRVFRKFAEKEIRAFRG